MGKGKPRPQSVEAVRTLELSKPIRFAGDEIHELPFREPTAEVLEVIEESQAASRGQTIPLLAYFTGVGQSGLKTMSLSDTMKAIDIVGELMVEAGLDLGDGDDSGKR